MIEDYIMDVLDEYGPLYVDDLILGAGEELDCTRAEVEDAIIRLEELGKARGYVEDATGLPRIERTEGSE